MKIIKLLSGTIVILSLLSISTFAQKIRIANEEVVDISTAHPYNSFVDKNNGGILFQQEFYKENATYIAIHFKNFELAKGDYVEINAVANEREIPLIYSGKGKTINEKGDAISDFWTGAIFSDKVVVKLYSKSLAPGYGFNIDRVAYGYPENQAIQESICGNDDKQEAICYAGTEMYKKSRAVCKLIIDGKYLCTGWLLGSEGHVMTNNHCIGSANEAQNTDFVFNFEYTNCNGSGKSAQDVVATTSTLIKTNSNYDYALVKLPVNPTSKYGYMSFRPSIPQKNERIYIPQHPGGARKQIAVVDDQSPLSGKYASIKSNSSSRVSYAADTEGGSSGSPVLSYNDNLVVALHNTGGCESGNGGNRNDNIISNLGSLMPANGVGPNGGGGGPTCSDGIKNGDETGVDCGGSCPKCDDGGGNNNCPPSHPYYACDRCWIDKNQAISGGCNEAAIQVESFTNNQVYSFSISNPVNNTLSIRTDYADNVQGVIMTLDGAVVKKFEMKSTNYDMNVSGLNKGIYVVVLKTDNTMPIKKKIVKE